MWPRVVELMLACWLLMMPLVFRGTPAVGEYALNGVVSGAVIAMTSLLSLAPRLQLARLGTLAVAVWVAAHGYFAAPRPGPPAAQNELVVGLILMLFAVLPNHINQPPIPWREERR
jgi:hypothetical protein